MLKSQYLKNKRNRKKKKKKSKELDFSLHLLSATQHLSKEELEENSVQGFSQCLHATVGQ